MDSKLSPSPEPPRGRGFATACLLLCAVAAVLLHGVFVPGQTLFSNDGPLGRLMSECHRLPEKFTGCWQDLNSVGFREPGAVPGVSYALQYLLQPVGFSKLYAPIAIALLGLGAWWYFRRAGLAPAACVLGGLAALLNSSFCSVACWGVAGHALAAAMTFVALAALADASPRMRLARTALAGLAVGMGVAEGADVGALFSVCVAAFVLWQAWIAEGPRIKNLALGAGRVALMAVCAGLLSAQTISEMVSTSVVDVTVPRPSPETAVAHWDWATQWSLPKRETLGLVVPGLFGYRMDTPDGGAYWGAIGRDPALDRYEEDGAQGPKPDGELRYTGSGYYAGVLVVLIALWAGLQALRRTDSAFSPAQRRQLWFWLGTVVVALLLAFGRFAVFYRLAYELPYFSLIRNPVKFLHVFNFAVVVLFAHGFDGLWRKYMQPATPGGSPRWAGLGNWWTAVAGFDKYWVRGCRLTLGLAVLAWALYASYRDWLEKYLQAVQFGELDAETISGFSIRQAGWFVLLFILAAGLVMLMLSGAFAGTRARWGAGLTGLLLFADLGRADQPWIVYWNYPEKYAANPVIEQLRAKPFEHRVSLLSVRSSPQQQTLQQVYSLVWLQQLFPCYNIQALDAAQMSRVPDDLAAFEAGFSVTNLAGFPRDVRRWQLTNTRYLLGTFADLDYLEQKGIPARQLFRVVERFALEPKPGRGPLLQPEDFTATLATNGDYAIFELTGTLPRAELYADWQVNSNGPNVLRQLASPAFDPTRSVFVAGLPPAPAGGAAHPDAGTAEISSYASKDVVLNCDASAPAVLLLNDRFDPNWRVTVDGKPATLLRCNFLMRGVQLDAGEHTVEFRFQPPVRALYVSLATICGGIILLGVVVIRRRPVEVEMAKPVSVPVPANEAAAPVPRAANSRKPRRHAAKVRR